MDNESKSENNILKFLKVMLKIIEVIITIIVIFISAIILTQNVTKNEKAFLGFRIYRVETGSMIPVYQIGDVILVKYKDFDSIEKGEDLSYIATSGEVKGSIITHRVVDFDVDENGKREAIRTKGVANKSEDKPVYANQITGVVVMKMNIVTVICRLISNIYIFYFCMIVPVTIYIFLAFFRKRK